MEFNVGNTSGDRVDLTGYGVIRNDYSLRNVSLIDSEGGLRYGALTDSEGNCACSRGTANMGLQLVQDSEERDYWVMITAPPADVTSVTIDFGGALAIDNVPIEP